MILQNGLITNQKPVSEQVVPETPLESQIPAMLPTRKPIFIYLIWFLVFCFTLFIFWGSYQIYQIEKQPNRPSPSPTTVVKNPATVTVTEKGVYACAPQGGGGCALYPTAYAKQVCPITFQTDNCDDKCDIKANWCTQ